MNQNGARGLLESMRTRRAAVLFAALLTAPLLPAPSATAVEPGSGPVTMIDQMRLAPRTVRATAEQVRVATVSMRLTDPKGVARSRQDIGADTVLVCPCVQVALTRGDDRSGIQATHTVRLSRTAGTATDGTWTGTFPVMAGDFGTWRVWQVIAGSINAGGDGMAGGDDWVALRHATTEPSPELQVLGQQRLRVTATATPVVRRTGTYTVRGRVVRGSAGRAVPGLVLQVRSGFCGLEADDGDLAARVRPDRYGRFRASVTDPYIVEGSRICVEYGKRGTAVDPAIRVLAKVVGR